MLIETVPPATEDLFVTYWVLRDLDLEPDFLDILEQFEAFLDS